MHITDIVPDAVRIICTYVADTNTQGCRCSVYKLCKEAGRRCARAIYYNKNAIDFLFYLVITAKYRTVI